MKEDSRAAWGDFWQEGGTGAQGGCLPKAIADINLLQRQIWREAAQALPKKARVLDLATGDGTVLGQVCEVRPDLRLIGVDSSPKLPPGPKGTSLCAGVAMEVLPFASETFALVTSQFGFEYGDETRITAEVARVLKAGAGLTFIIHHRDSPIVTHNRARRAALAWAIADSSLLEKARALAFARATMPIPTPPSFRHAVADARAMHPTQTVAAEFVMAIVQALELGQRSPPVETLNALQTLERKGRNEAARIEALERAACGPERIVKFCDLFTRSGLQPQLPQLLREQVSGLPFAWLLTARKI